MGRILSILSKDRSLKEILSQMKERGIVIDKKLDTIRGWMNAYENLEKLNKIQQLPGYPSVIPFTFKSFRDTVKQSFFEERNKIKLDSWWKVVCEEIIKTPNTDYIDIMKKNVDIFFKDIYRRQISAKTIISTPLYESAIKNPVSTNRNTIRNNISTTDVARNVTRNRRISIQQIEKSSISKDSSDASTDSDNEIPLTRRKRTANISIESAEDAYEDISSFVYKHAKFTIKELGAFFVEHNQ
jgi:hypothetical protein